MANGKRELIEDISDIRRLAGLSEAPKKAAPNPQDIEGKGDLGGIFGNPRGTDYQSSGGQVVGKDGKVNWGDPDSASDFFRADKMRQAQQAPQAAPAAPKAAAPKPAAPKTSGGVPPQPTLNGQPSTGPKGQAWLQQYGSTHNSDGTPKSGGTQSTFDREGPSPVAYNTNPLPGPKSPVNPEGPQAADLSRPGSDDPLKNYTLPPGSGGGATDKAPGFGTNITPKAAELEPQSITNQPPADNFKPVQTPPDYKSPTLTQPKSTFKDPRPPKDIVNPMDQYRQKPFPQSDMAPTVDNARRLPPGERPLPTRVTPTTPQINPSTPKLDTPPNLGRGTIAPAPMPVIRTPTPNVDNMPVQQFKGPNTDPGMDATNKLPKIEPFKGDMGDSFTGSAGSVPKAAAPAPKPQASLGRSSDDINFDTADKDPDTMKDIVKELRQMAGIPEDGIPDRGMAQEAMNRYESEEKMDEEDEMEEGNEFSGALAKAKATHQDKFEVGGKTYNVKEAQERTMSRAAKGYEKYGKEGMQALAKAGKEGKDLDKVRDKYNKYDDSVEEGIEVNPINDSLALIKRLAGLK